MTSETIQKFEYHFNWHISKCSMWRKSVHIPKKKIQNWSMYAKQNQLCSGTCPITRNLLTLLGQPPSTPAHDVVKWYTGCHCKRVKPPYAGDFRSNNTTEKCDYFIHHVSLLLSILTHYWFFSKTYPHRFYRGHPAMFTNLKQTVLVPSNTT